MTRALVLLAFLQGLLAGAALAQVPGVDAPGVPGLVRNEVIALEAAGARLYAGPRLIYTDDGETFIAVDDPALDPPDVPTSFVYALATEGDTLWAGLAFVDAQADPVLLVGAGFAVSTDALATLLARDVPLDFADDTLLVYGVDTLRQQPVASPFSSPPYEIALDPTSGDVWSANGLAGLRLSQNGGRTWERTVLPPDTSDTVEPFTPTPFVISTPTNPTFDVTFNFVALSVLVDETGTVWAGTLAGLNRSTPADVYAFSTPDTTYTDRAWTRFSFDGSVSGLLGETVLAIEAQPTDDPATPEDERDPVWIAVARGGQPGNDQQNALLVTRDGGSTFEPSLVDELVFELAFRGDSVFAAGANGLFISPDGGTTWSSVRAFPDAADPARLLALPPTTRVLTVAVTQAPNAALWVGTDQGLLRSRDFGRTFTLFRTDVPPGTAVPETTVYAYPNPYSPAADGFLRIRFDLAAASDVRVRIYDLGLNRVRELAPGTLPAGPVEAIWDGTSEEGVRVANGVYLYVVEAGGSQLDGKIVVLQ